MILFLLEYFISTQELTLSTVYNGMKCKAVW